MGDQHDGPGEGVQRVLEHVARLDIEMVRRLVQAQQVRRIGQELGERQPRLLATGQDADLLLDGVAANRNAPSSLRMSVVDIIGAASFSSSNTVLAGLSASIWCCAKYATAR